MPNDRNWLAKLWPEGYTLGRISLKAYFRISDIREITNRKLQNSGRHFE